jgi:hypothetical protein
LLRIRDSHALPVVAVHAQPGVAVTSNVPVPAFAPKVWPAGVNAKVQAAPLCTTVTVCPATVSVPVRLNDEVFPSTV